MITTGCIACVISAIRICSISNTFSSTFSQVDKERHRISLGMKNSYINDATSGETYARPSSGHAVNGDALPIGIQSTSSPESSSQGREDLDDESVDGKDLFLAEVESRASIPPLEVPLDDTENLDMGDVVNQNSGGATTNFGTSDDKNQKHVAKKAKRLRYRLFFFLTCSSGLLIHRAQCCPYHNCVHVMQSF